MKRNDNRKRGIEKELKRIEKMIRTKKRLKTIEKDWAIMKTLQRIAKD